MGGDAFEGVQKLTNAEYLQITEELIQKLNHLCIKIQPYIPLPQKQIHGDIDFLVILKPQFKAKNIVQELKIQKFIFNNNDSINSVYKNKQVDFFFVQSQKQFKLASFYKSYSGIGAFLGIFLPTKQIKLTPSGLFAVKMHKHIKFEYLINDNIKQILQFYGLNYQRYNLGFKNRQQLFQFLRLTRFLDEQKYISYENKSPTKIMLTFNQYLKQKGINFDKNIIKYEDALNQTLQYFNKQKQFNEQYERTIKQMQRIQKLNDKFNGKHILDKYKIQPQQMNKFKNMFRSQFANQEEYYKYIELNELQKILKDFSQKCQLSQKQQL